jgi:hypothetical protein
MNLGTLLIVLVNVYKLWESYKVRQSYDEIDHIDYRKTSPPSIPT